MYPTSALPFPLPPKTNKVQTTFTRQVPSKASNMEGENTKEVSRKRRKVERIHDDDDQNEDEGQHADHVTLNIHEHYRKETLQLEDKMVSFFKCSFKIPYICSFTTKNEQSITTHIKGVHYGIKPFRCSECSFACAYEAKLQGHQMKKHGATQSQWQNIEIVMDEEGEKVFNCPKCDYSAKKIGNVKKHMAWHSKGMQSCRGRKRAILGIE